MNNLVTYHLHQTPLLPPSDAHFYQFVIAQNGVFVRAENAFVSACLPVTRLKEATAPIRGLQPLTQWVQLKIPQIPLTLLEAAIADAQVSAGNGRLDETLSYVVWANGRVGELTSSRYRLIKPNDQRATPNSVLSEMVETAETVVMDIHSHGGPRLISALPMTGMKRGCASTASSAIFVVTFGVLVSLFVSLTLTPMLCSRFLTVREKGHHHSRIHAIIERGFQRLDALDRRLLTWSLLNRWKIVLFTLLTVGRSSFFFMNVGKTFAPEQDEGRFLVYLRAPLGSSIDYTDSR